MTKTEERQNKYAELILKAGLGFKKGMCISITAEIEAYPFARKVAEKAYEMGAKYVYIEPRDLYLQAVRTNTQNKEDIGYYPDFLKAYDRERVNEKWGRISIDSTESFDALKSANQEMNLIYTRENRKATEIYHNAVINHTIPWVVICVPGIKWAKKTLGENASVDDMWDLVASILFLDEDDPVKKWFELTAEMKKRRTAFNNLKIKELHYTAKGTDFTVGFNDNAVWMGGEQVMEDGTVFIPNLPTFEIYTAPDYKTANGYITTKRPVNVQGDKVEEATFHFENGKVIKVSAKNGQKAIENYLNIDEGSPCVGEIALVDNASPISMSKKIFTSILYDENASCHIALGSAYPDCVKGGKQADTDEKKHALGLNTSIEHTDFMVGDETLSITATLKDGTQKQIMKNGLFVI